ncbi:hypothetical protein F511_17952 [Dorcoceras hygrometricum]|uniref:Uncharacterized protein n=1 Tax=Dorcoceras hygrometricum TaxID=472368 RepID=A0A2Z7AIN5_9LAMI|nr:hypothetical protein F511_17952 [Dorcoceras hygrometricum]
MDLIRRYLPPPTVKSQSPCDSGWSQAPVASKIRKTIGSDTTVGDPDRAPRVFKTLPCWHLCLAPTGITRTRLFSIDCGRNRQSDPRPETRLLRQPALEGLTRSARTDSPRRIGRKRFSGEAAAQGGGGGGY